MLLKQSNVDSAKLAETIGVSDAQLRFVSNSSSGTGLLKCGSVVIPFDNRISKETDLYRLYNTNLHEKIAEGTLQGSGNMESADMTEQETELAGGFIPEWDMQEAAVQTTEPAGGFISGWEMPQMAAEESDVAGNIFQPDSMEVFGEDNAPTKIYEPKHRMTESRQFFSEPQQTETAGSDWMIYG